MIPARHRRDGVVEMRQSLRPGLYDACVSCAYPL
jgi:hypothetical protein